MRASRPPSPWMPSLVRDVALLLGTESWHLCRPREEREQARGGTTNCTACASRLPEWAAVAGTFWRRAPKWDRAPACLDVAFMLVSARARLFRVCVSALPPKCLCAFWPPRSFRLHCASTMTPAIAMPAAGVFSLVFRLVAGVAPIDSVNGSNVPFLFLVHLAMHFRNLAFVHSAEDTARLANYVQGLLEKASVDDATAVLASALCVDVEFLDVTERVVVCLFPFCNP